MFLFLVTLTVYLSRTLQSLCSASKMDFRLSFHNVPLFVFSSLAVLSWTPWPVSAGKSCSDTRQVYAEKGYSTNTAPLTQISGRTDCLYICTSNGFGFHSFIMLSDMCACRFPAEKELAEFKLPQLACYIGGTNCQHRCNKEPRP